MLLPSAVCLVQEAIGTSGACCRCSFPCCQLILCTRLCVHDSRHASHNGSRKSHVSISSHRIPQNLTILLDCATILPAESRPTTSLAEAGHQTRPLAEAKHQTTEQGKKLTPRLCETWVQKNITRHLNHFHGFASSWSLLNQRKKTLLRVPRLHSGSL